MLMVLKRCWAGLAEESQGTEEIGTSSGVSARKSGPVSAFSWWRGVVLGGIRGGFESDVHGG